MRKSGYGARRGFGKRPAVLVVDAQYKFVGIDAPILESMDVYPISIGQRAWGAVRRIDALLGAARSRGVPILYSTSGGKGLAPRFDSFARKKVGPAGPISPGPASPAPSPSPSSAPWPGDDIVDTIAPQPGDVVFNKAYPSCFFATPLMSFLNTLQVDTLLIVGFVTGGCVRSTVIDAMSYNFNVLVPEDAVADRMQVSHYAALLDLDMKYADVTDVGRCVAYLQS